MSSSRSPAGATALLSSERHVVGMWPSRWVLVGLPTALLALSVIILWHFEGLYGQDPYEYYGYAVGPLRSFVSRAAPLPAMFWPLGYPLPVTLASFLLGTSPHAAQAVSLIAGVASVLLTFLLTRDLLTGAGVEAVLARRSGVLAALLVGVCGWTVQSSSVAMPDTMALATSLLSAWALVHWLGTNGGPRGTLWLSLASTALAWSIVTRWGQLALVPVFLVAAWPAVRRPSWRLGRSVAIALMPAMLVLGVQLALTLTVPRDPAVGSLPFAGDFAHPGGHWSWLHPFMHDFSSPDGSQRYAWPNALYYASAPFRAMYLTPLFFPPALAGIVLVVRRARGAAPLLLLWPAALLSLDMGLPHQSPRYVLAALPPIAALSAFGVNVWLTHFGSWRRVLMVPVAAAVLVVAVAGLRDVHWLVARNNADLQVARWAAASVPRRSTVLSFDVTLTLDHATRLHTRDLYLVNRAGLVHLIAERRPLYLLARLDQLEGQWANRPPGINFRFLRSAPGLVPLGSMHGYDLFRIGHR